jgi:hypothetical protein
MPPDASIHSSKNIHMAALPILDALPSHPPALQHLAHHARFQTRATALQREISIQTAPTPTAL